MVDGCFLVAELTTLIVVLCSGESISLGVTEIDAHFSRHSLIAQELGIDSPAHIGPAASIAVSTDQIPRS